MIFAQDSPSSLANMYGSALTTGSTVKDVREWPDRIKAVTAAQVQAAAVKFLKSDQSVTAYLLASPETSK
jgi:zinc protease